MFRAWPKPGPSKGLREQHAEKNLGGLRADMVVGTVLLRRFSHAVDLMARREFSAPSDLNPQTALLPRSFA